MPKYMNRTGLFDEHKKHGVDTPRYDKLYLTVPAMQELERLDNTTDRQGYGLYEIVLSGTVPDNLVFAQGRERHQRGLRLNTDPEFSWEQADFASSNDKSDFQPCPKCGAALAWYEAGYVPGYRVCAKKPHHHVMV